MLKTEVSLKEKRKNSIIINHINFEEAVIKVNCFYKFRMRSLR